MSLTFDEIIGANDKRIEEVEVPEWGGTVFVQSVSGTHRDEFDAYQYKHRIGDNEVNLKNFRALVCVLGMCDKDGVPLCGFDKVMAVGAKNCIALHRVYDVSKRLNAIGDDEVGDAVKN